MAWLSPRGHLAAPRQRRLRRRAADTEAPAVAAAVPADPPAAARPEGSSKDGHDEKNTQLAAAADEAEAKATQEAGAASRLIPGDEAYMDAKFSRFLPDSDALDKIQDYQFDNQLEWDGPILKVVDGSNRYQVPYQVGDTFDDLRKEIADISGIPSHGQDLKDGTGRALGKGDGSLDDYLAEGDVQTLWLLDGRSIAERGGREETWVDVVKSWANLDLVTILSLILAFYTVIIDGGQKLLFLKPLWLQDLSDT